MKINKFKTEYSIILLTGLIILYLSGCADKKHQIINSVKENLTSGKSFTEVESFLKKQHFEYSYDNKNKTFTAILRNVGKNALTSENICLLIIMDENNNLKTLDVQKKYTGL
jgi:hypothetical protein